MQAARVRRPRVSETPQGATFVELFFDLVFVYAVTQVTALLVQDLTWGGAARAAVVAWLVWWAWQQFTWALSPADTTHPVVEFTVLVATAVAFFMARSVPEAFAEAPGLFLVPYLTVRVVGMALYAWVGGHDRDMGRSMGVFALASLPAAAALALGSAVDPSTRVVVWAVALVLDLAAGVVARHVVWRVHVAHFAERHGLFVIIALGESLIAIGMASAPLEATIESFFTKGVGVSLVGALWWLYFGWFKDWLEERVAAADGIDLLRNSYSFLHFLLVAGVVGVAAALEEVVAHPGQSLDPQAATALALGVAAYAGAVVVLAFTAGRLFLASRVATVVVMTVIVVAGATLEADGSVVVAGVTLAAVWLALVEHRRRPRHV